MDCCLCNHRQHACGYLPQEPVDVEQVFFVHKFVNLCKRILSGNCSLVIKQKSYCSKDFHTQGKVLFDSLLLDAPYLKVKFLTLHDKQRTQMV